MTGVLLAARGPLETWSPTLMAQLALLLPALAALVVVTFTIDSRRATAVTAFLGTAGMLLCAGVMAAIEVAHPGHAETSFTFLQFFTGQSGTASEFGLNLGVVADPLGAVMLLALALTSLLVIVSALDSVRRADGFIRLVLVSLTATFAMAGVILSPNYFETLLFWMLLSASGYLLVGHWWGLPAAAAAARRAFLYLALGDALLLVAIVYAFFRFQDLNFGHLSLAYRGGKVSSNGLLILALLVLGAAVSKSAQLPLHAWLTDAVEAPAPAAALVLGPTLASSGVYLVARTYDLFHASPRALAVLAVVGAASAITAAVWALGQRNLKRGLAFAAMSNLGLILLALGLGAFGGALLHLFTSVFAVALLFLAAGAVGAGLRTERLAEMGGLLRRMPVTGWTTLVAMASLCGIPPLAGSWSKDAIWTSLLSPLKELGPIALALASLLLAAALARLFAAAFLGETARRRRFEPARIQDAAGRVRTALILLAIPVVVAGVWALPLGGHGFLNVVRFPGLKPTPLTAAGVGLASLLGLLGAGIGWLGGRAWRWPEPVGAALESSFYLGHAVAVATRRGSGAAASGLDWIERRVLDGALAGFEEAGALAGRVPRRLRAGRAEQSSLGLLAGVVLVIALALLLVAWAARVTG